MSAQFSKGDRVEIIRSADEGLGAGFPVGGAGTVHTLHLFPDDGMVYVRLDGDPTMHAWFLPANLRKVEPEDKADLYVEPEPLKNDQHVLVWAQVNHVYDEGDVRVTVSDTDDNSDTYVIVSADAIVRPSAGQVPPWVKPIEEPTGLGAVVSATLPHGAVGVTMVRYATWDEHKRPWQAQGGSTGFSWDQMTDVTVLSEGWADGGAS